MNGAASVSHRMFSRWLALAADTPIVVGQSFFGAAGVTG
jgi:hypothetical protein